MAKIKNKNAQKHGGDAAIKRLQDGQPFAGLARSEELHVREQLELFGRGGLVLENATRLQTAANLYWDAIVKAVEDGNLAVLDRYVARYGWLAGAALRAWAQVKSEQGKQSSVTAEMVLASIREVVDDGSKDS
jgi:hypothetical protein